jgi:hypothetical protein
MKGNSKRPKGVVIAVFWISLGWTTFGCMPSPYRSLKRSGNLRFGASSHGCDVQDNGLGIVWPFNALKSLQGRQPLPFLGTICRAEDQELSERGAVPCRNMASNSDLAIASLSGGSRRG